MPLNAPFLISCFFIFSIAIISSHFFTTIISLHQGTLANALDECEDLSGGTITEGSIIFRFISSSHRSPTLQLPGQCHSVQGGQQNRDRDRNAL